MNSKGYVLVADDDDYVGRALSLMLRRSGLEVKVANNPDGVIALVRESVPGVIVMDMNFTGATTGQEGLELLRKVKVLHPEVPVILITAWGSIDLAVEGMKLGAADFITKPWRNEEILRRINTALELRASDMAASDDQGEFDRCGIVGESRELQAVLDTVRRVAPTDAPVLILGENGTGKELIARALHANSRRASGPMVSVNLGGVPQALFESEMFGYVKGAFTDARTDRKGRFELANGGTMFLDEIGELDPMSQVKMLRVLQEHTFERLGESTPRRADFRLVSATNADLASMVDTRAFREDLFYRINLITLKLPPLRQRRDDIEPLARHFIEEGAKARQMRAPSLGADALDLLRSLPYPGNIRELRNRIERALVIYGADVMRLEARHFSADLPADSARVQSNLEEAERETIVRTLNEEEWNLSRTAMRLGITRQALYRRLAKFGIDRQ